MSIPSLDIQRSKLAQTMATNARFGSKCKSKVFFTIVGSTLSIKIVQERNEIQGDWCKTNLLNHIFSVMENTQYFLQM
jgi:hypothetical protein